MTVRGGAGRIGIAGMGISSPLGSDPAGAFERLCRGEGAVSRLSFEGLPDVAAARVDEDLSTVLPRLQQVGTERASLMALAAARRAWQDAGGPRDVPPGRIGLYVGTGMGGASTLDAGYAALHAGTRLPPLTVPAGMVNGPAAIVAMHLGIEGPVITHAVACASSAVALAEGAHALRRGEVDLAIVGGVEAPLARGTVAAWQALRTLAPPDEEDAARSCRPFSARRRGLVLGEGAAFLVLAREEDLPTSGPRPVAWLRSSAVRCNARHLTHPQVDGQVAALREALRQGGLTPADVGHCNAHGTGTPVGDPVECEALRQVWGESAGGLLVSATKGAHGHLLGAAGAMEAIWTALALREGRVPPTLGLDDDPDPACRGLDLVAGLGRDAPALRFAVSNSFAFGGTNVAVVLERA